MVVLLAASLTGRLAGADSPGFVAEGQRALLTLQVEISGIADYRTGHRDSGVKWRSRKSLDIQVEMEAGQPSRVLTPDLQGAFPAADGEDAAAAPMKGPPDDVLALQEKLKACPEGDNSCRMQIAMQIMNTQHMKEQMRESRAMHERPLRYQAWRTVAKGGRVDVSASVDESWESVFYTAGREWAECTLKGPQVSPALTALGSGLDHEKDKQARLEGNARQLILVVDVERGASSLRLLLPHAVPADEQCKGGIGNSPREERNYRWVSLQPPVGLRNDAWLDGHKGSSGGNLIAGGKLTLKGEKSLDRLGPGFGYATEAMVPLEVKVTWELTRL